MWMRYKLSHKNLSHQQYHIQSISFLISHFSFHLLGYGEGCRGYYSQLAEKCKNFSDHPIFVNFVTLVILIAGVVVGFEKMMKNEREMVDFLSLSLLKSYYFSYHLLHYISFLSLFSFNFHLISLSFFDDRMQTDDEIVKENGNLLDIIDFIILSFDLFF